MEEEEDEADKDVKDVAQDVKFFELLEPPLYICFKNLPCSIDDGNKIVCNFVYTTQ